MSSLIDNTSNRISSSSIMTNNTTYSHSPSSGNCAINATNDCNRPISSSSSSSPSSSSSTTTKADLAAMSLTTTNPTVATANDSTNSENAKYDSKLNTSTSFKSYSNASSDYNAGFWVLNRTVSQPPPSSSVMTGTLPFNIISQSSNDILQFASDPTG